MTSDFGIDQLVIQKYGSDNYLAHVHRTVNFLSFELALLRCSPHASLLSALSNTDPLSALRSAQISKSAPLRAMTSCARACHHRSFLQGARPTKRSNHAYRRYRPRHFKTATRLSLFAHVEIGRLLTYSGSMDVLLPACPSQNSLPVPSWKISNASTCGSRRLTRDSCSNNIKLYPKKMDKPPLRLKGCCDVKFLSIKAPENMNRPLLRLKG